MHRTGQVEAAEPVSRAIDGSFFAGPGPGSTGYVLNPDGTYMPHTDFSDTTSMYVRNVVEGLLGIRMQAPDKRLILQPSFPLAWDHASIRLEPINYQYSWKDGVETMAIKSPHGLAATVRLRAKRAKIDEVTVNGKPAQYKVEAGIGVAWIVVETPPSKETQVVRVVYGDEPLPAAVTPNQGLAGETYTLQVDRGRIESVRQARGTLADVTITNNGSSCSFPLPAKTGVATWFASVRHGDVVLWVPGEVEIRSADPVKKAAETADTVKLQPKPVDMGKLLNQRLAAVHANPYSPRSEMFYWAKTDGRRTMQANGRSWWEERHGPIPRDTSRLTAAKGTFLVDERIPFGIPAKGNDAVFTSLYDSLPNRIEIPANQRARKVAMLVAASIPLMQSRFDNGRIRVNLHDGSHRELVLRNQETIDDWLGSGLGKPYVLSGHPVPLGTNTHGHLYMMDLGGDQMVKS